MKPYELVSPGRIELIVLLMQLTGLDRFEVIDAMDLYLMSTR